jgi:RNA polymerase sigma-70 factor (TIGR02960 family)
VTAEGTLARARAGDEAAFKALTDPYRRELQLHCYRILSSVQDAEDVLQETLLAAWRGLARFEERASLRAWLYRIATNRCLNALRAGQRRPGRVMTPPDPPFEPPEPTRRGEPVWLQPYPDALLEGVADLSAGPEARYETKEAVGLAFVAGLQHLPPRQRAVLVLRDVLGFRAMEVARMLDSSEASVNSALKRARTALEARLPAGNRERAPMPRSPRELDLVARFTDAFENDDVDGVVALLTDDAWYTMPPVTLEYQGPATIARFLRESERWRATRRYRLVPTRANGQPAFGCYLRDAHAPLYRAHGLIVLTLEGDRISAITRFTDSSILACFGLPRSLPT